MRNLTAQKEFKALVTRQFAKDTIVQDTAQLNFAECVDVLEGMTFDMPNTNILINHLESELKASKDISVIKPSHLLKLFDKLSQT
jgi:hypothetical protein